VITSPPAVARRSASSPLSSTSKASRSASDLDPVDGLRLPLVEELEPPRCRAEEDDASVVSAPVGELLEPERVAVEGQRRVEVVDRQGHPQLPDLGHGPNATAR
jgi:hypothetical protein